MSTSATINFTQIRQDHDLRTVVTQYLGQPKSGKWLCPFHKEKTPSFTLKGDKFKCFGCGVGGDVTDFIALMEKISVKEAAQKLGGYVLDLGLSPAEIKAKQVEIREEYQRRQAAQLAEEERKTAKALERVSQMTGKVEYYHSQVGPALDYWQAEGILPHTIKQYKLGYCPNFPLWKEGAIAEYVPSYVIPYFHYGELVSIRHRLKDREGDKYRPEFAGLPCQLYNVDCLDELEFSALEPGEVCLIEGEKKSLVLGQQAIQAVGLPGVEAWKKHQAEWIPLFQNISCVYVILDPNAEQQAREITLTLNGNGISAKYIIMPCKPDDYFTRRGGTTESFLKILEQGRRG